MNLKMSTRRLEGVAIVDCDGRLVFGDETAALRSQVKDELAEARQVVLNLAHVNYVDSGGLGTLVGLFTSARAAGGDIKLAGLTPRVVDLLNITKLATIFEAHKTVEDAVAAFHQRTGVR
jgi:anti-sigma B factor antagonist